MLLINDLNYLSLEEFHKEFNELIIRLNKAGKKFPVIYDYDLEQWIAISRDLVSEDVLEAAQESECDELCIAEAMAAFLLTAGELVLAVSVTAAVPPISALIAFGGSIYAVLKLWRRL